MEWGVLQELRCAPLDPSVRRLRQPGMELLNKTRFAEPWLAHDQHELAFAGTNALPPAGEQAEFFITTDKRRKRAHAASSACTASSNDAEELDRLGSYP